MSYDTSDPEIVKERKSKAQSKREEELERLKELLGNKHFRKWLWKLLDYAKVFHTSANLDPHSMAIASGKRDVGLRIFGDILAADPNAYSLMITEKDDV